MRGPPWQTLDRSLRAIKSEMAACWAKGPAPGDGDFANCLEEKAVKRILGALRCRRPLQESNRTRVTAAVSPPQRPPWPRELTLPTTCRMHGLKASAKGICILRPARQVQAAKASGAVSRNSRVWRRRVCRARAARKAPVLQATCFSGASYFPALARPLRPALRTSRPPHPRLPRDGT